MDTYNFSELLESLEKLPIELKNKRIDIGEPRVLNCSSYGCLGSLISIVAYDMPELKEIYRGKCWHIDFYKQDATGWSYVLNEFLDCDFKKWAGDNPDIWDNEFGASMWYSKQAFGRKEWERLTHDKIIVHLRKAYNRWIVSTGGGI